MASFYHTSRSLAQAENHYMNLYEHSPLVAAANQISILTWIPRGHTSWVKRQNG